MDAGKDYLDINRRLWNKRVHAHISSGFYDVPDFLAGKSSLRSIELDLLGDISDKSVLHLQCHFGQDSLSLVRMGASVTGVDLSDEAIGQANILAEKAGLSARFICTDIYALPDHLDEQFDVVFTSYGTIGWLPDMKRWADVVARYLKPGGAFVFAEFHPVVWMFDNDLEYIRYAYFNREPIIETEQGTYADKDAAIGLRSVGWNHSLAEVLQSLLETGLALSDFKEFDYSPYNIFPGMTEVETGKFQIEKLKGKLPLVYALRMTKP